MVQSRIDERPEPEVTDQGDMPAGRTRRLVFALVILAASGALGLVLAEIGLRLLVPVTDVCFYFWDPVVGPRRAPNQDGRNIIGAEIDAAFHTNAQGWNHREDYTTVKPSGTRRVCVVGDSYVEALQVPYEQSFFALAQEEMSRPDRPVQWYAFGNSGYGTTQAYLLIHHYVLDYDPDVVIILFVQNDPFDCSPYLARQEPSRATFSLDDEGELVLKAAALWEPILHRRLAARLALVRYLNLQKGLLDRRRAAGDLRRLRLREGVRVEDCLGEVARGMTVEQCRRKTWELIEAILARAQDECSRRGAVLALAYRGSRPQIEAAAAGVTYTPPPKETDPYCLGARLHEMGREFLEPITTRLGMPYLDLAQALIAAESASGKRTRWVDDGHYNEVGHAATAKAMATWVEDIWRGRESPTDSSESGPGSR